MPTSKQYLRGRTRFFHCYLPSFLPFLSSTTITKPSPFSSCTRLSSKPRPTPTSVLHQPPSPKKIPFTVSAHRRSWVDPYHWMSNTNDPDLVDYLHRENSYASAFMEDTEYLQRRLVSEMKSRMATRVTTTPEKWGPWSYYQYIPEKKEYPLLCRTIGSYDGFGRTAVDYKREFRRKEEVLLDWNAIGEEFGYVHVGICRISPNHKFLAYTLDISGNETFILQIKEIQTGHILQSSKVEGVVNVAWAKDSNSLIYTACVQTLRPTRVFCKRIGSEGEDDLVFEEKSASCVVDVTSTKDGKFITINSNSRSSSEVRVMNASDLQSGPRLVRKRMTGVQYFLEHHHGFFYILTNAPSDCTCFDIGDYHLCRARENSFEDWEDIIFPGEGITIQDMDVFDEYLVLFLCKKGISMLCSIDMPINIHRKETVTVEDLCPWFFPMPSITCSVAPGSNHDYVSKNYRVIISSPVMPDMIVDYDMTKKNFAIVHQEEVAGFTDASSEDCAENEKHHTSCTNICNVGTAVDLQSWGFLSKEFVCERQEVVSHDGSRIPLTILCSPSTKLNGQSPGLLYGYGSYGEELDKRWCTDRISLLNRGWVIAFADVRGGGGGNASWHQAGVVSNKLNSIHDFVACGKFLKTEGYVHTDRLCAIGVSAGGFLVGATINMFPDLFNAIILKVPFLDICNTLLDPSLPLTTLDYEEFGDPRDEIDFKHLRCFSPYDNISLGVCVPSMLVTASFNDSRVGVWEAAKWVAKIRDTSCSSCSKSVILRTNMAGGHFGEGGRYKHCEETALEYAFLIKAIGLQM